MDPPPTHSGTCPVKGQPARAEGPDTFEWPHPRDGSTLGPTLPENGNGMSEKMDTEEVIRSLTEVLRLQGRSLLLMTLLAGSMGGVLGTALKPSLRSFVADELTDTYQLVEKMSALGGNPSFDVASVEVNSSSTKALTQLLDNEQAAVAGLHEVIAHSGQEPHSEALEHLLEHMIMRKQSQVDFLVHATRAD